MKQTLTIINKHGQELGNWTFDNNEAFRRAMHEATQLSYFADEILTGCLLDEAMAEIINFPVDGRI